MIGETGERKSAVATPDGKSRKKKIQAADMKVLRLIIISLKMVYVSIFVDINK